MKSLILAAVACAALAAFPARAEIPEGYAVVEANATIDKTAIFNGQYARDADTIVIHTTQGSYAISVEGCPNLRHRPFWIRPTPKVGIDTRSVVHVDSRMCEVTAVQRIERTAAG